MIKNSLPQISKFPVGYLTPSQVWNDLHFCKEKVQKTLMNNDTDSAAGVSQTFENNFSQNYQLDQFASHKTILFET